MIETGGTVRVAGNIMFSYEVHSRECNVFSVEDLVEAIRADPMGWFIDMYLGAPTVPDTEENSEKYEVLEIEVLPGEGSYEINQVEEITDKYNVPNPDCAHGTYDENDQCVGCKGDRRVIVEWEGKYTWDGEDNPDKNSSG